MGNVRDKAPLPTMTYDYYEVFAREKIDDALEHIGCLSAPNNETAIAQARLVYSEKPWVELCIAPRNSIDRIISANDIVGMV